MIDIEKLKEAVVAIGYYIPKEPPKFHGTGFLVGEGDRALTCAHVVIPFAHIEDKSFKSFPPKKKINGKIAELSCWLFRTKDNKRHIIRFPVKNVATYLDKKLEGLFFNEYIDVAYLELDVNQWIDGFGDDKIPSLMVSGIVDKSVGLEVMMIGFPSPDALFIDDKRPEPKCWEPMTQFAKLAGILPFKDAPTPEFLAFDTVFAKGSSGSPIIALSNSRVLAIAARLHPFRLPIYLDGKYVAETLVPSSLGFGVPSNFFYELSKSRTGVGKFKI